MKLINNGLFILLLVGILFLFKNYSGQQNNRSISSVKSPISHYTKKIQPIFNNRCVVCHSCYNSPCQLNLTSYEGVDRGANKDNIYSFNKRSPKKPTRLFIDATSTQEWREKHSFFPVISPETNQDKQTNLDKSLLYQMLELKDGQDSSIEKATFYNSIENRQCPTIKSNKNHYFLYSSNTYKNEFEKYRFENPSEGMPYGFPKLDKEEFLTIRTWIENGAKGPELNEQIIKRSPSNGSKGQSIIEKWEQFLNNPSIKSRISSRYIYEHLFLAHINLKNIPNDFFRLIRAKNEEGTPQEISTTRPYDNPGVEYYYRLKKITNSIVHKTHIVYELSDQKMNRYKDLFLKVKWKSESPKFPSWKLEFAANPFLTFKDIPAKSRYQFLLDNAQYHVMTFIRGPVCKGQSALNVIDDHFWVLFVNPKKDVSISHSQEFFEKASHLLAPPVTKGESISSMVRNVYKDGHDYKKYRNFKSSLYQKYFPSGRGLNYIWDGDKTNNNALLTVYRHFDSATVKQGAVGGIPKTVWVIDYPIFENIYYNLVAGYSVFGPTAHQLKTRLHMELSRINSQDNFLHLLPSDKRLRIRKTFSKNKKKNNSSLGSFFSSIDTAWLKGLFSKDAEKKMNYIYPYSLAELNQESQVSFVSDDHKKELLEQILSKRLNKKVRGFIDPINCCENQELKSSLISPEIDTVEKLNQEMKKIASIKGPFANFIPNLSFIRIKNRNNENFVYTMIRNQAHFNVSFIFNEKSRLDPKNDTVHFYPGFLGSYPNYLFSINWEEVSAFLTDLKNIKTKKSYKKFIKKFGVSRRDKRFWPTMDWFHYYYKKQHPKEAGLFDLNRYLND